MKLSVERNDLLKTLSHIHGVVERKSTIPILSNVKIEADGKLKFSATNVDLEIVEVCPAVIAEKGTTTVNAALLYDIVRKIPDGAQIELEVMPTDNKLHLKSGKSKFSLATIPSDDFPVMSSGDLPYKFTLSPDDLVRLIDKTKFAMSTEETRYFLNGIYLHAAKNDNSDVLRSVATDAHRLARQDVKFPAGAEDMPGVIVPRRVVTELRKLLEDTSDNIQVEVSETKIKFSFSDSVLTSKLIDGKFPDYEKVIPTGNDKVVKINKKVFAEAVDRVSAVSFEKSKSIKLHVSDGALKLTADTPEAGSAVEEIEAKYKGDKIEIAFNSKYLLDILSQIEGKEVNFVLADSSSPALVQELNDETVVYVLMPMRI
jgi:DNA polymerase-3 subunit beta